MRVQPQRSLLDDPDPGWAQDLVETVAAGWNVVVGANEERIVAAVRTLAPPVARPTLYGDGHTAERCARLLGAST